MDSERTQAELYVTQYNLRCCNVEMLRGIVVLYGLSAYFSFFVAQVGQTYVCASILTVFTVLYWIITGVMLWTMKEVTFYQSALFSGVGAVLRGLYFSSVGLWKCTDCLRGITSERWRLGEFVPCSVCGPTGIVCDGASISPEKWTSMDIR